MTVARYLRPLVGRLPVAGRALSTTLPNRDESHGPPSFGMDSRPEALAYQPHNKSSPKKPVAHVRDGGDIDWSGIQLPVQQSHMFGPGAADGEIPTDFEQSTGRERFELMYRMAGIDPWHIAPLEVPYKGTMKNPVFIWASNPFRIVGCTGYPKDSHDRFYMRVRMGPVATRCTECGTAYALDYCGPFRNEHGRLLSLADGSTPENPKFVEDAHLHELDHFKTDVELDFRPSREDWAYVEKKRWEGWHKGETPDNWELLHADAETRKLALSAKETDERPLAWWDYAKGSEAAKNATVENPKNWWGSYLWIPEGGHH